MSCVDFMYQFYSPYFSYKSTADDTQKYGSQPSIYDSGITGPGPSNFLDNGLLPEKESRDLDKSSQPKSTHYLTSNCVLLTYFSGETAAVVDEHFSRALSQPSSYTIDKTLPNNKLYTSRAVTSFLRFLVDTENTHDYVRVYDGRYLFSSTLTTLTGSVSLRTVTSTANYMLIQFITDGSVNRTGFRATYEVYDLGYGNRCSSISLCTSGLTCLDGHCACPTTQYYNPINGFCLFRVSFRNPCPLSEECLQGLVCRESVCLCLTTQYYQYSSGTCKNG
uniref:CUB domain-containing protein n=1 Tax=Biomphalaria glabrata TaxID=6526 RepID=A0A2C9KAT4_BIOGL